MKAATSSRCQGTHATPNTHSCGALVVILAAFVFAISNCDSRAEPQANAAPKSGKEPTSKWSTVSDKERADAVALLDSIEKDPGFFSQMCRERLINSTSLELYAFERGEQRVSPANFKKVRQARNAVLCVIEDSLLKTTTRYSNPAQEKALPLGRTGISSDILVILIDLNGTEVLEALCAFENTCFSSKPHQGTSQEKESSRADWQVATEAELSLQFRLQVLSTIAALLRQENFAPLLSSDLDRRYCDAVKKSAEAFRSESDPDRSANRPNDWYVLDRHCHEMVSFKPYLTVPYTDKLRDTIVQWARDFCAQTPVSKRLAEKGMSPWPITR